MLSRSIRSLRERNAGDLAGIAAENELLDRVGMIALRSREIQGRQDTLTALEDTDPE